MTLTVAGSPVTQASAQQMLDQFWRLLAIYEELTSGHYDVPQFLLADVVAVGKLRKKMKLADKAEREVLKELEELCK